MERPPGQEREQRHFQRIRFDAPARISGDLGEWQARVLDLSLCGVLVERPPERNCHVGERCVLEVALAPGTVIRMEATVTHTAPGRAGLRCDHIDVDSITHLRRLVELNLGDPELLERELAALG